jgi:hypothetical protein
MWSGLSIARFPWSMAWFPAMRRTAQAGLGAKHHAGEMGGGSLLGRLCCIWSAGGMLMPGSHWGQIAKASSANATATRRLTGSSTATS